MGWGLVGFFFSPCARFTNWLSLRQIALLSDEQQTAAAEQEGNSEPHCQVGILRVRNEKLCPGTIAEGSSSSSFVHLGSARRKTLSWEPPPEPCTPCLAKPNRGTNVMAMVHGGADFIPRPTSSLPPSLCSPGELPVDFPKEGVKRCLCCILPWGVSADGSKALQSAREAPENKQREMKNPD